MQLTMGRCAQVSSHWRLAARDADRLIAAVLTWRDATHRETIRGLMWRSSDPTRRRLGTKQMGSPVGRCEDALQDLCNKHFPDTWTPWQVRPHLPHDFMCVRFPRSPLGFWSHCDALSAAGSKHQVHTYRRANGGGKQQKAPQHPTHVAARVGVASFSGSQRVARCFLCVSRPGPGRVLARPVELRRGKNVSSPGESHRVGRWRRPKH